MRTGMRTLPRLVSLALLALLLAAPLAAATRDFVPVQSGPLAMAEEVELYAPDRVLVKFTRDAVERSSLPAVMDKGNASGPETGLPAIDAVLARAGARTIERPYDAPRDAAAAERLGVDRWFMVRAAHGDMRALAAELAADPDVESATVDWVAFPAAVPNDANYDRQWGHNNVGQMVSYDWSTHTHTGPTVGTVGFDAHAEAAWDKSQGYGDPNVVIAILDSGVDIDHPDLNLVAGYDFGDNDTNPDDDSGSPGHGTACAGVAAAVANNGIGVAGIAGGSSIMPCKVANNQGSMYFSSIQDALYWAADNGADVISMSFGAYISSDPATDTALSYAWNAGCILFAATGNENYNYMSYPANHADVIAVGAASPCGDRKRSAASSLYTNPDVDTDPNDYTCDGERWWGSCYGPSTQDASDAVDVIAPTILPTTDIGGNGGYESGDYSLTFNGTSCATPYAAGVAALVISANPTNSNQQVWDAITGTATDVVNVESGAGWDRYSGYGLVNADAAIGNTGPVPPTAQFVGSPVSGDYPLNVQFTDQSSG